MLKAASVSVSDPTGLYVVVEFYPWFKFCFLLFQTHYHTLPYPPKKKRKFKPRIKLNRNIYIHFSSSVSLGPIRVQLVPVVPLSPVPFCFSSLSWLRTGLHYLNAWNRLEFSSRASNLKGVKECKTMDMQRQTQWVVSANFSYNWNSKQPFYWNRRSAMN